jgi:pantoate--beta-alanine ligase
MKVFATVAELKSLDLRQDSESWAFVPTMGNLHAGHGALIATAKEKTKNCIVSIFVNPLQFDQAKDLNAYPRTLESDLSYCQKLGVDAVFCPTVSEVYPVQKTKFIVEPPHHLSHILCGQFRPGHFQGMITIVSKLLTWIPASILVMGEKDWQQLQIVRAYIQDFHLPITLLPVPTVREADGLALSSRNQRLSPQERKLAPLLYRSLWQARAAFQSAEFNIEALESIALREESILKKAGFMLEYFDYYPQSLQEGTTAEAGIWLLAAWLGQTRLIDNLRDDDLQAPSPRFSGE